MKKELIYQQQFTNTFEELKNLNSDFEAWIFADKATRKELESHMKTKGYNVKIYSAYKPLVYYFLELVEDWSSLTSIKIGYPQDPLDANSKRFLLEAYPLASMLHIEFYETKLSDNYYVVDYIKNNKKESHKVFAPNRVHLDHVGQKCFSPTGWLRFTNDKQKRLETDYEKIFWKTMSKIMAYPFSTKEPFFKQLIIDVTLSIKDDPIEHSKETISLMEALHEEFYFSLLEWAEKRSVKTSDNNNVCPGQIVPNISYGQNFSVKVYTTTYTKHSFLRSQNLNFDNLSKCNKPLPLENVEKLLEDLIQTYKGHKISGQSVKKQTINGAFFPSNKIKNGVLITAAQHANEATGVVGALRACKEYLKKQTHPLALIPVHNVDGYNLYHMFLEKNPYYMYHAARYTALGNDLEYQHKDDNFELAFKNRCLEKTNALLHLNLHGYPAHEWTRPLTGYIPKKFSLWTIPKGFFLIMRYKTAYKVMAYKLIEHITSVLATHKDLVAHNKVQLTCYKQHNKNFSFDIINDFAVMFQETNNLPSPLNIITEYPDESLQGEAFRLGHKAQMITVLSALDNKIITME